LKREETQDFKLQDARAEGETRRNEQDVRREARLGDAGEEIEKLMRRTVPEASLISYLAVLSLDSFKD